MREKNQLFSAVIRIFDHYFRTAHTFCNGPQDKGGKIQRA